MADHGFTVAVHNRTTETMERWLADIAASEPSAGRVRGHGRLEELVADLEPPRKVVVLVKSSAVLPGERDAVDAVIGQLLPLLAPGDIVVDGGNSNWNATIRRAAELKEQGIRFVGSGVSGGEVGARFGPSLMPGGDPEAWPELEPIWSAIAAKVNPKTGKPLEDYAPGRPVTGGEPCTAWIGPDGAGHYVKMVHNGIEYIDMQLIAEAYHLMGSVLGLAPDAMAEVFAEWNAGDLDSYLIEITADILGQRDPAHPQRFFVDAVLDTAGQKGTGKWTSASALDLGVPANAMAEAVFARFLSALKDERVAAAKKLKGPEAKLPRGKKKAIAAVRDALYCSKVCAYAQGFQLMAEAQREHGWQLDFAALARIWRGGCIIRARFLQKIADAYRKKPELANLMLAPYFRKALTAGQEGWRRAVVMGVENGVSVPAFSAALAYYDGYRSKRLPANLLQAQRDYFGAHTYERVDQPRARFFHLDWPEPGRPEREA
jgi:6-phosphogluconate dehydrogenase